MTDHVTDPVATKRRRRTPEEAREEILNATRQLFLESPAHEVTVLAIMQRTTMSRKSFYVYFADRAQVVIELVRPLRIDADRALKQWRQSDDTVLAGRAALLAAARLYREHGPLLRAIFWSSADDSDLATVREELTTPLIGVATRVISRATDLPPARAKAMARVLATMNIHTLLGVAPDTSDAELQRIAETLSSVWERAVFLGRTPV